MTTFFTRKGAAGVRQIKLSSLKILDLANVSRG
jgi:hypothetical protein